MGFSDPITAGDVLIREAIQSPNYSPGSTGWTINRDGTAEFTGLTINQGSLYLYDTTPALRLAIDAVPTPAARFYSTNPAETSPARLRAFDQGGAGRLELVGPELGGFAAGRVLIDSQDITVTSAVHSGTARFTAPAGNVEISASGTILATSPGNLTLQTTGVGEIHADGNLVVDNPHVLYVGLSNFYADMGIHSGGKILLDAGSWIKRGAIAGVGFQNGWGNAGGWQSVGYVEYPDQTAGLVGVAAPGTLTAGTVMFNIPAAIRPAANHIFLCPGNLATFGRVIVEAGGNVVINTTTGTPTYLGLSGCRWPMNGF